MLMSNQGAVKAIQLPDGWVEKEVQREPLSLLNVRRFQSPSEPGVQVQFVSRGCRYSSTVAGRLSTFLQREASPLTADEYRQLAPLLLDLADESMFELHGVCTFDLNGRRVLLVQGRWRPQQYWLTTVFIDVYGTGEVVEEVICIAPFAKHLEIQAMLDGILRSIEWVA
jgi:hypothetical protein